MKTETEANMTTETPKDDDLKKRLKAFEGAEIVMTHCRHGVPDRLKYPTCDYCP